MIHRYFKGCNVVETPPPPVRIISIIKDDEGNSFAVEVPETSDMSVYGSYNDWSLSSMIASGIAPESFSSPAVAHTRLEAAESLNESGVFDIEIPTE